MKNKLKVKTGKWGLRGSLQSRIRCWESQSIRGGQEG